ncbi:MAG TPA: transposase [Ktedonosporobacter sp.]|nr:transposase [Ktedonosporobacter sp.]
MAPSQNKDRPSTRPDSIHISKPLQRGGKQVVITSHSCIGNWLLRAIPSPIATSTGNSFVTAPSGRKKDASDSQLPRAPVLAREAVFLFLRRPEDLVAQGQETLALLRSLHTEVDQAYALVQQFTQMLRERSGEHLDGWLDLVNQSGIRELQSFAKGVEKDKEAVRAGLCWWINNGVVEGHVTKLKLIKRQGYGQAGFPLLRKRVLHTI